MFQKRTLIGLALAVLAACGDGGPKTDAGQGGSGGDAALPGGEDALRRDGGLDAGAAGESDLDATADSAGGTRPGPEDASPPSDPLGDGSLEGSAGGLDTDANAGGLADDASAIDEAGTPPADAGGSDVPPAAPDAGAPACDASRAPALGQFGLRAVLVSDALSGLTDAVQPPGSNDWYLVEQRGRVLVLREGQLLDPPFLDLSSEIALRPIGYEDRGLVSIVFAPDYASSGRFYVSVTPTVGMQANLDLLLQYQRSLENPDRADPSSRATLLELQGSRTSSSSLTDNIHNGGRVAFGPDGMLYLALGDGGGINCGDVEPDAPQNLGSLFGKLLRLDLTQPPPYAAQDNPFVLAGDPRVLHYGLRNPFRFSFDRLTGDLYLGDVGQNRYEELDYAPRGARGLNFGWPAYEGASRETCPQRTLLEGASATPPIFVIDRGRSATGPFRGYSAVIGGVVYRGAAVPALQGAYLFGDYGEGRMGALYQCGSTTSAVTPINKRCDPNAPNEACFRSLAGAPVFRELRAIVEDHQGELYMVANGNSLLQVVANE